MSKHVITQHSEGVLTLRLNRPDRYNAWTTAMRDELTELLERSNTDDSIKAVILTGTGNDAFCAGQDLAVGDSGTTGRTAAPGTMRRACPGKNSPGTGCRGPPGPGGHRIA